ncbi:MAG TPA: right-handed parallel beta-helix repeat-containing protein [Solirubrobacteraceae bacterium]|nr:right-handed parallel beta-helix repeat-containing protein [Solirubrobacteraceae bacterium]
MTQMGSSRTFGRRARRAAVTVVALASTLLTLALAADASAAPQVMIVTQGGFPGSVPANVHYFHKIQEAVDATKAGSWVLIEPGTYDEEVKITKEHSRIYVRGMDRNTVILDGQHKPLPGGSNGIEIFKANNVWVENLTVRNFDRAESDGPGGNEIWWNGGEDSGKIGAHGWYGRYLTAYDDGLLGGYGIFTNNEVTGEWENIYASGFNDSGIYLGACQECNARIDKATLENNALGYSGSNSGGKLVIENSVFSHNTTGIAPNSENPGDGPPPQNGACEHHPAKVNKRLPMFSSTEFAHCTFIRNNLVEENNNINAPDNPSSGAAPWGAGIELPGDYGDVVEGNTIKNNPTDGVMAFEYPNPFPIEEKTLFFQLSGNRIVNNTFSGNGYAGGTYAGDVFMSGGLFGSMQSTNNCLSGNTFTAATYPGEIEGTWGCQNKTTPNPELGFEAVFYLLELQAVSEGREEVAQPAPPAQATMPNPCEGVPANPLCP